MSLSKKITLSFLISAFIIAILAAFIYLNFIGIRKEIRNLEFADTIRSMSLQLRRYEKNFFLFGASRSELEEKQIRIHLAEFQGVMTRNPFRTQNDTVSRLQNVVDEYRERFEKIRSLISGVSAEFALEKHRFVRYKEFFRLIELTFYDRPLEGATFFEKVLAVPPGHNLVTSLRELDREVNLLRKNGEDILTLSNDLDKIARDNSERTISSSQKAILIFFPLFLVVGVGTLFYISSSVVKRLGLLVGIVEKTGQGDFSLLPVPEQQWGGDEIGGLIRKCNRMEEQLAEREEELHMKNKELIQSKKLAAIGILASGVAHELSNPLNNILISTQVLQREAGNDCSPFVNEILEDIVSQSIRVKKIIGDLLEYARGKEPHFEAV
jgi:two-component system, NtrC family, sensor kinase